MSKYTDIQLALLKAAETERQKKLAHLNLLRIQRAAYTAAHTNPIGPAFPSGSSWKQTTYTYTTAGGFVEKTDNGPEPDQPVFVAEPVEGWRCWALATNISKDEPRVELILRGVGQPWHWQPRENRPSACLQKTAGEDPRVPAHTAPAWNCWCGYWSFKDIQDLADPLASYRAVVVGQVNSWGRIVETDRGYRSEYAYPKHLYVVDDLPGIARSQIAAVLQRTYRVPCEALASAHELGLPNLTRQPTVSAHVAQALAQQKSAMVAALNQPSVLMTGFTNTSRRRGPFPHIPTPVRLTILGITLAWMALESLVIAGVIH